MASEARTRPASLLLLPGRYSRGRPCFGSFLASDGRLKVQPSDSVERHMMLRLSKGFCAE